MSEYYLRFGKPPEGGYSKIGFDDEYMEEVGYAPGATEEGVSVYSTHLKNGKWYWEDPDARRAKYALPSYYQSHMANELFADAIRNGDVFLVTGDLIPKRDFSNSAIEDEEEFQDEMEEAMKDLAEAEAYGDEDWIADAEAQVEYIQSQLSKTRQTYATGADGEPLLRNLKIVKTLKPQDVMVSDTTLDKILRPPSIYEFSEIDFL